MEEAQTSQSLNPHAQEFRPFSSNYSHHHYHHNYPSNCRPPPTSTAATTTAITAFLSPPPPQEPPVLPPHQHFHQNNYQNYPHPLNTIPHHHDHHYYYYYPKPLSLSHSQDTLLPHPLLHPPPLPPPPPPPPPARPKPRWVKSEAAGPSGSGSNVCRRRRGQGCNYGNEAGLISGRRVGSHDPQGQNGNVDYLGGARRVWVERGEKKNKKLWRRERMKKEVMPVKPQGMETTVMIRNVPNQYTTDANKGYAFVNFTQPEAVQRLHRVCNNKRWKHCSSSKICQIACAAIQGKENLTEHFGRSRFMCNKDEYLPVCFSPPRDGSGSQATQTIVGERVKPSSRLRS
ncbi:hypothetical protein Cgig2_032549 [Carnegiea gigantea]|uniref:Mei2-like C-terminal RNA recognition motif domain-containing protein n=1 Tax=Carnegiea gigantea TaxID=171969 RepID=A0A9Q1KXY1_9CARY|nr:hypothetical protein Cgig2_032549 [Carnegiea gigantea]